MKNIKLVKKNIIFLPIGCVIVVLDYLSLIITKRRTFDGKHIISDATKRKKIYSEFELFK